MRAQHGAQHGSQAAGCECVWVAQPKWHGVKMACVKVSEESRVGARRRPARIPFMYELGHVITCALCATGGDMQREVLHEVSRPPYNLLGV